MKNFKFSVQSVLDLKAKFEENEKAKLLKLKNELNALFNDLAALHRLYEINKKEYRELASKGTTPSKYAERLLYLKEIDNRISFKNSEIDKIQAKIEIQANVLKEINKEVKMLEKLKEKQLAIYNHEVLKENELLIDDFLAGKSLRD